MIKIDVSYSKRLIKLPNLSQASKLKHVYLEHCMSLRKVPSSIENVGELITLNRNGFSSIQKFPKLFVKYLCLVLSGTLIDLIPWWILLLDHLKILNLFDCQNRTCLMLPGVTTSSENQDPSSLVKSSMSQH